MTTDNEHGEQARERTGQQHVCVKCGHNNINRNNGRCCEFIVPRNSREGRRCGCKCEFVPVLAEHREQARAIHLPFPCGCLNAHEGGGMVVEEYTCESHQAIADLLSSRDAEMREVLEGRLTYVESKDLHNGWSGSESGPCCEACRLRDEHFTGRADALKALVGCRNPFQLPEVCQCHLPVRQAVKNGQIEILKQVLRLAKLQPKESSDVTE